jgi:hypothetical protein
MKTAVLKAHTADTKTVTPPATMATIENTTKTLADARTALRDLILKANAEVAAVQDKYRDEMRQAVADVRSLHVELANQIDASRELFAKPKSRVFSSIQVGLKKQSGKLTYTDAAQVVKLIKKHFPEQAELLINTT